MSLVILPQNLMTAPDATWVQRGLSTLAPVLRIPMQWAYELAHVVIIQPLASLYLQGPVGMGFWGGASPADICAGLAPPTSAAHWNQPGNHGECIRLIENNFWSWLVFARTIVYFLLLAMTMFWMYRPCFYGRRRDQQLAPVVLTIQQQLPEPATTGHPKTLTSTQPLSPTPAPTPAPSPLPL